MGITRKQLREFGASDYLVKRLTKGLPPTGNQRRPYLYDRMQVLESIRSLIEAPKIHKTTKAVLKQLEVKVSELVDLGTVDDCLRSIMSEVSEANTQFEQTAQESRAAAEELQNYRRQKGNFAPKNNIVQFSGCP